MIDIKLLFVRAFSLLVLFFISCVSVQWFFQIVEVLPNTWDDKNLEYITLQNISLEPRSLSWYVLSDLKKDFHIEEEIFLEPWEQKEFLRPETKLILNNSNEEIRLTSPEWVILDQIEYKKSIKWEVLNFRGIEEVLHEEIISDEIGLEYISDEVTITEITENTPTVSELEIPEVVFSFQRPSYIEYSEKEKKYICDSHHDECKVNLDLRNSFSEDTPERDYICSIDFWFWTLTWQEQRCNPNTIIFPKGIHNIIFRITHEDYPEIYKEKNIIISNIDLEQEGPGRDNQLKDLEESDEKLIIEEEKSVNILEILEPVLGLQRPSYIEYSKKEKKYICDSEHDECKVNFDFRESFSEDFPERDYRCLIDFWFGKTWQENRCNPNTLSFPKGEHEVIFTIFYKDNETVSVTESIIVSNLLQEEIENNQQLEDLVVYGYIGGDTKVDLSIEEVLDVPEVIFSLQRPSYIEYSEKEKKYICDSENDECKVNFDLRGSFSDDFLERDYRCEIDFGEWIITWEENKCNPNTVVFPEWEHNVIFRIYHEDSNQMFSQKNIHIFHSLEETIWVSSWTSSNSSFVFSSELPESEIHIIAPKILVQSGLEWDGRYFYCKKEECKINLNYEKNHKDEKCLWSFWSGITWSKTTHKRCNPGYVSFETWVHELSLRVYEKGNESNKKEYVFYVYNNWVTLQNKEIYVENKPSQEDNNWDTITWRIGEDRSVWDEMTSEILLQWKIGKEKTVVANNLLECYWVEKCYVNFSSEITWNKKGLEYLWLLNGKDFSKKENPKWIWLDEWDHDIILQVWRNDDIISITKYYVVVSNNKNNLVTSNIWSEEWIEDSKVWEKKLSQSALKKIFTQNFFVLKYDGLRISGKAPAWSRVEIYLDGKKLLEAVVDEKWKYKLVTKTLKPGSYIFDTKIIYQNGEELFIDTSWEFELLEEKTAHWISEEEAKKKEKKQALKKIFTQNFLVLKYDGLRISGKAPVWSRVEIYYKWQKILEWTGNEKWKYRIVTKNLSAWKYSFDTKIIFPNGETLYITDSWEFEILSSKIWNWFVEKKKRSSFKKQSSSKFPKLILEADAGSGDISAWAEIPLFRKILIITSLSLLMLLTLVSLILRTLAPMKIFILESQRLTFWVREKICLLV